MGVPSPPSGANSFDWKLKDCPVRTSGGAFACIINTEIGAVLAVMRRNVRWGVRYMTDDDHLEHPLIQSLKNLRKEIFHWQPQWKSISPAIYLQPFLDVIQSDETGAPITGVALSAVYKILTIDILDVDTVNVEDAMHLIVDAVTSCRFEVTDPASEEVVLMKILQVLLACMKSKVSNKLTNQHVCNIVNTCFRVVHQASSKGELLQRIARHTMHEMVRCIFTRLSYINKEDSLGNGESSHIKIEGGQQNGEHLSGTEHVENGNFNIQHDGQPSVLFESNASAGSQIETNETRADLSNGSAHSVEFLMTQPYGVPCMVEIFHFLCSLLNAIDNVEVAPRSNPMSYDEDVPLFALGLINSAIELGGSSFDNHPKLLGLIQDELFRNLMEFGLYMSPLILSTVCSIVLNLYHHMRAQLKLQMEAFFSCVLLRLAQSKHGSSYQQQEVVMEAIVDLCRQQNFMTEMYTNFDCDISCNNVFEDLSNLLSRSAFPVNSPLSAMNILALDGLVSMIHNMADRTVDEVPLSEEVLDYDEEHKPFWTLKCKKFGDPDHLIPFLCKMKYIKKKLTVGADHFNRDSKKGFEFLQRVHLLPDKLDPHSVACFFRFTGGLDKNLVGDFLGNHDEFCIEVLREFAGTFDFQGMSLDAALRYFVGTFRLPGESQKIQRVLEAFAERYYQQSPKLLVNKDAALVLSYSIILLNTDQHNAQVKKKMTEEDFIRNNRQINGGNDLPREFLSEIFHSICKNEILMMPEQGTGFSVMSSSRWISLMHNSKKSTPFVVCDSASRLDYDMFSILAGPTVASISVVYDNIEREDILQTCIDGFLDIAKISACYHLSEILDDLVVSLCKFTTLLAPLSIEESIFTLVEDAKARLATVTVFTIAIRYGDCIRSSWKNIVDCVLNLLRLGLLRVATETVSNVEPFSGSGGKSATNSQSPSQAQHVATPRKSFGLMGRFSRFFSYETEEHISQSSEEQNESHQQALQIVQNCQIGCIFTESKFLQADSLLQLVQALISSAKRLQKENYSPENEDTSVFCLELLIEISVNNRDRIMLLWPSVYAHISSVVHSTVIPCTLVEKAVFGLLQICQRLLPYKENFVDELLKSLQLVLKLDARVADAYCEHITQEVMRLVKTNATQIRSHVGWRTITSLLSITARHPEASEAGFETLEFIMSDGSHLLLENFILCVDAAMQFAESRVGLVDRSVRALDLMAGSVSCLLRWSNEANQAVGEEVAAKVFQDISEMWMRLVQGLRKVCLDQREEVRKHAILVLQGCLAGGDGIHLPRAVWLQCFEMVIFTLLDELLEIAQGKSAKDYRDMEGTLVLAIKLLSKVFLHLLQDLSQLPSFCKLWLGYLGQMENYLKVKCRGKRVEKVNELVSELLKNTLLVMKTKGILVPNDAVVGDSFWQLTWLHVKNISPSLKTEVFPSGDSEDFQKK